MTTFVDTSALIALLEPGDPGHPAASSLWDRMGDERARLVTHDYVVVEATAVVQRRLGLVGVERLDALLAVVGVERVGAELFARARAALFASGRGSVSFVDWTSILMMRDRGIRTAFTFDGDFVAQGFEVVPA
jgi:predicted nucleic acid-binding protein